jgi:hypothetical protein
VREAPTRSTDTCADQRISSHVLSAARRLANLDEKQVNAVAARIELDLRIGYAFSRFITNSLRTLHGPMDNLVISYGEFSTTLNFRSLCLTFPRVLSVPNSGLRGGPILQGQEFCP